MDLDIKWSMWVSNSNQTFSIFLIISTSFTLIKLGRPWKSLYCTKTVYFIQNGDPCDSLGKASDRAWHRVHWCSHLHTLRQLVDISCLYWTSKFCFPLYSTCFHAVSSSFCCWTLSHRVSQVLCGSIYITLYGK